MLCGATISGCTRSCQSTISGRLPRAEVPITYQPGRSPAQQMSRRDFFIPGDCEDLFYRYVRDRPEHSEARAFVESLWQRYRGYEDPHFLHEARYHFLERFWEMHLAVTLLEQGCQLVPSGDSGPEFYFAHQERRVWVEAVAPGPGSGIDRVPEIELGKANPTPTEKILLRFTNALVEKRSRYLEAVEKGIVQDNDLYLLAINCRAIPHAPYGNTLPYFVQALLPFGNRTLVLNKTSLEITDSFYERRDAVYKVSGAPVSTDNFLNPQFAFVSAVLHSAADCVNGPQALGRDFIVLHNPSAAYALDDSLFAWCEQMFYRNDTLERIPEAG